MFYCISGNNDFANKDDDSNYDWILDETPRGLKKKKKLNFCEHIEAQK
jgi:hypothetical protein